MATTRPGPNRVRQGATPNQPFGGRGAKCNRRGRYRGAGGAVLEAIIALPILVYLVFGAVEFGYYFHVRHTFENAARAAARVAITPGGTYTNSYNAANRVLQAGMTGSGGFGWTFDILRNGVSVGNDLSPCIAGDTIQVHVYSAWSSVKTSAFTPLNLIGASKQVDVRATMRHE